MSRDGLASSYLGYPAWGSWCLVRPHMPIAIRSELGSSQSHGAGKGLGDVRLMCLLDTRTGDLEVAGVALDADEVAACVGAGDAGSA